jgi:hypothetical protein
MTLPTYNGADSRRDPGVFRRIWAMIVKEFVQMRRDRMTFASMLFVPVLQLTLFGALARRWPADPRGVAGDEEYRLFRLSRAGALVG